ncbi:MAG: DNA polymerase IV [Polyangiaceae bacterium]|nr:DNA polymerase IV [Polyangiaceae bacterium]
MPARICCLDLDTFFVSVERLFNPSLVGKPVVVGGERGARGVVTAASYEVRPFGVRSGISLLEASRLAPPNAVFLPTRHGAYSDYSARVREVIERYSPEVRAASIDEFYIDFAGCEGLYRQSENEDGDAAIERAVRAMCAAIRREINLPASAGIGATRVIAKVASGRAKPEGVLLVPQGGERAFLLPLPVRKLPGIGPKTEERLVADGIHTLGDLANLPTGPLRSKYSRVLAFLEREIAGNGPVKSLGRERPAFHEHDPEGLDLGSISNERTFFSSLHDESRVLTELLSLAERVCFRARKRGIRARTVTLKLRYSDFDTFTRARTMEATSDEAKVYSAIVQLYRVAKKRRLPIRLVGVGLSNLIGPEEAEQLSLPFCTARPVGPIMDEIREKYGYESVHLGGSAGARRVP